LSHLQTLCVKRDEITRIIDRLEILRRLQEEGGKNLSFHERETLEFIEKNLVGV
jgi:hypothetical protein